MSKPPDRPQYPPTLPLFGGPRLKVLRAESHLGELAKKVGDYLASGPFRVVQDLHGEPGNYVVRIKVLRWPPHAWGAIVGDILGNLRAALDQAVYDLTIAHSGEPLNGTAFPIFTNQALWGETTRKGKPTERSGLHKVRGIHEDARRIIEEVQPYNSDEDASRTPLGMLNRLINIDKHRTLTLAGATIRNAVLWKPKGSETWVTGAGAFIDGQQLAVIYGVTGDDRPNIKLDLAFEVAFDYWTPYEGTPVLESLRAMRSQVVEIIAALMHFVWK